MKSIGPVVKEQAMSYWFDYMVENERRRQELAAAEARRQQNALLNSTTGARQAAQRHHRLLAYIGEQLIILGCRLQSRYEVVSASTSAFKAEPVASGVGANSDGC